MKYNANVEIFEEFKKSWKLVFYVAKDVENTIYEFFDINDPNGNNALYDYFMTNNYSFANILKIFKKYSIPDKITDFSNFSTFYNQNSLNALYNSFQSNEFDRSTALFDSSSISSYVYIGASVILLTIIYVILKQESFN